MFSGIHPTTTMEISRGTTVTRNGGCVVDTRSRRYIWIATAIFSFALIFFAVVVLCVRDSLQSSFGVRQTAEAGLVPDATRIPLRFTSHRVAEPLDKSMAQESLSHVRLHAGGTYPLSLLLHSMRLFGLNMPVPSPKRDSQPEKALDLILNHDKAVAYFGYAPLVKTRYGARVSVAERRAIVKQIEREAHPGELLAVLAEQGLPLDTTLTTSDGEHRVMDILCDTLANFHLDSELPWVAMSLAHYLPPQRTWYDKFGHQHDFNEVAERLMGTPFDAEGVSCRGTHLVGTVALLFLADQQRPIFSNDMRTAVRVYLSRQIALLETSQIADGGWHWQWFTPDYPLQSSVFSQAEITRWRVLVTGHHVEWMLLLPDDLRPPDACFERAGKWLHSQVLACEEKSIDEAYCPYSHAANVVRLLSQ